jgi:aspartate/methionine/tyrosine aminotransferase
MKIKDFGVEIYMNAYEDSCTYNLAETCVSSFTFAELTELIGGREKIFAEMSNLRLSYGHIFGSSAFKQNIASLYKGAEEKNIVTTHGAIGANHLVLQTLLEPGDEAISVLPTYQQLYSIPESVGAKVKILPLNMENNFLPSLELLAEYMTDKVRVVCLNNPNNPSGSVMDRAYLEKIVQIVKPYGAYILCDEVYRGLVHEGENLTVSIFDLYDKGISTSSMSKVFSLAGLRLGWIVAPEDVIEQIIKHRDYNTISCGVIDDYLAALTLQNKDKIFARSLEITRNNLAILDEWINNDPYFSYIKPKGGTTAFIKFNFDTSSKDFCLKLLEETGVFVVPGTAFDTEGYMRIGYAYEPALLKTGLNKISEFTKALLKS